jgi:hypothetical protein
MYQETTRSIGDSSFEVFVFSGVAAKEVAAMLITEQRRKSPVEWRTVKLDINR